jgi:hypothetical protein
MNSDQEDDVTDMRENEAERLEQALETIDDSKRASLRKLIVGSVFVAPVVASFAINGLTVSAAHATAILNSTVS